MTITYELYSPDGMYPGVIPKEYVVAAGGETYKYASSRGGKKMTRKNRKSKKRSKKTRARKLF